MEKVGYDHGVEYPFQGTVATTNGESIWAFRYLSEGKSRSLYFSTNVATLRQLHPEVEILHGLGEETRLVVSEPLGDLPGAWNGVPESAAGVIRPGTDEMRSFRPIAPRRTMAACGCVCRGPSLSRWSRSWPRLRRAGKGVFAAGFAGPQLSVNGHPAGGLLASRLPPGSGGFPAAPGSQNSPSWEPGGFLSR